MKRIMRFDKEDTILIAIDFQEKLMPAVYDREKVEKQAAKLVRGMDVLGIPIIATTQYKKGLGETVATVGDALGQHKTFDKVTFSAYQDESFRKALEETGRKTVVLIGAEAHICVQQTALDLMETGYNVALAADCVSSRELRSIEVALDFMGNAGIIITTGESILFELLGSAIAPEFKEISRIVK